MLIKLTPEPATCAACKKEVQKGEIIYIVKGKPYCDAYCAVEGEGVGER